MYGIVFCNLRTSRLGKKSSKSVERPQNKKGEVVPQTKLQLLLSLGQDRVDQEKDEGRKRDGKDPHVEGCSSGDISNLREPFHLRSSALEIFKLLKQEFTGLRSSPPFCCLCHLISHSPGK